VLVVRPDRDANRVRGAERGERPDDHALAQQRLEPRLRVLAEIGEDEVADCRSRHAAAGTGEDPYELGASVRVDPPSALELSGKVEACNCCLLGRRGQIECAARLAEGGDDLGGTDAVAHPETGEPIDLGKSAQDEHAAPCLEVLLDAVGVIRVVDVLEVGLVEDGQDVVRNSLEVGVELGAGAHRSRRVVRMAHVHELGALGDRGKQCLEVVAVVAERDLHGLCSELARIDPVARERGPAVDDLVARLDDCLRERVDDAVGA